MTIYAINVADDQGLAETPNLVTDRDDLTVINEQEAAGDTFIGLRPIVNPTRGVRLYFRLADPE